MQGRRTYDVANLLRALSRSILFESGSTVRSMLGHETYLDKIISEVQDPNSENEYIDVIKQHWISYKLFSSALYDLRTAWLPTIGKGSQSNQWETYKTLAAKVTEICDAHISVELEEED